MTNMAGIKETTIIFIFSFIPKRKQGFLNNLENTMQTKAEVLRPSHSTPTVALPTSTLTGYTPPQIHLLQCSRKISVYLVNFGDSKPYSGINYHTTAAKIDNTVKPLLP